MRMLAFSRVYFGLALLRPGANRLAQIPSASSGQALRSAKSKSALLRMTARRK